MNTQTNDILNKKNITIMNFWNFIKNLVSENNKLTKKIEDLEKKNIELNKENQLLLLENKTLEEIYGSFL